MLKEKQKVEALKRMEMLELHENVINEFTAEGKLNLSEYGGLLYWLNDEQTSIIKEFEEESGNLVYHVLHNHTEFGEMYTMLYVSKHEEEWQLDIEDIENDMCCAYVKNVDDDWCSEYGYVRFKKSIGGLIRVA
jgi:hypothetical protein